MESLPQVLQNSFSISKSISVVERNIGLKKESFYPRVSVHEAHFCFMFWENGYAWF